MGVPAGLAVQALCGAEVESANDAQAWLWPTCLTCAAEARIRATAHHAADRHSRSLLGLRPPR